MIQRKCEWWGLDSSGSGHNTFQVITKMIMKF